MIIKIITIPSYSHLGDMEAPKRRSDFPASSSTEKNLKMIDSVRMLLRYSSSTSIYVFGYYVSIIKKVNSL